MTLGKRAGSMLAVALPRSVSVRTKPRRSAPVRPPGFPAVTVESLIVRVRGQKVILSADLARVYGVPTKALNQAVRRNSDRFPDDFVFRLTLDEARDLTGLRSQSVTLGWGTYS